MTWHRRHDGEATHPRSLVSSATLADYDLRARADPHLNGTIWGASLWDARASLCSDSPDGARTMDKLVLLALLLIGSRGGDGTLSTPKSVRRLRTDFAAGSRASTTQRRGKY